MSNRESSRKKCDIMTETERRAWGMGIHIGRWNDKYPQTSDWRKRYGILKDVKNDVVYGGSFCVWSFPHEDSYSHVISSIFWAHLNVVYIYHKHVENTSYVATSPKLDFS